MSNNLLRRNFASKMRIGYITHHILESKNLNTPCMLENKYDK